jgi:hypothetical protein
MECAGSPPLLRRHALHQTPIPAPARGLSFPPALAIKNQRANRCSLGFPDVCRLTRTHLTNGGTGGRSFSSDIKCLAMFGLQPLRNWYYAVAQPVQMERKAPKYYKQAPALQCGEEKVLRVHTPTMDGLRADQTRRVVLVLIAHQQRIAIGKVRRNLAIVGNRNIRAFFSQLYAVPVVAESMWHQSRSQVLPARHRSKQHQPPPRI